MNHSQIRELYEHKYCISEHNYTRPVVEHSQYNLPDFAAKKD